MNEEKIICCQCGNCRWYDGIGDECMIRPGGKPKDLTCDCWKPGKREKK